MSSIFEIIRAAIAKRYDKFNIVIRNGRGEDIGYVPVCLTAADDIIVGKTIKFYKIYVTATCGDDVDRRRCIAYWYAIISDVFRDKNEIETVFDCRIVIDDCWGYGAELCDFHRYINNHGFAIKAVDDLLRSYATYKNGEFVDYLKTVKEAIARDGECAKMTYSLLSTSGRPSLDRAYKSFRL